MSQAPGVALQGEEDILLLLVVESNGLGEGSRRIQPRPVRVKGDAGDQAFLSLPASPRGCRGEEVKVSSWR